MSEKIFMSISETGKVTGLSACYLRKGVKDGTIPHIKSGTKFLINVSMLQEQLDGRAETRMPQDTEPQPPAIDDPPTKYGSLHCVYKHTFPDGMVYVGQTISGETERRWAGGEGYRTQPVYKAILNYGWANIKHEIIEDNIPDELINSREAYYINLYNAVAEGYNSMGGEFKSERLQLLVRPTTNKRLMKEAAKKNISKNELINRILEQYLYGEEDGV